jgi:hypothetical protein
MNYGADGRRYDGNVMLTGAVRVHFANVSEAAVRACVSVPDRFDAALSAWPCWPMSRSARNGCGAARIYVSAVADTTSARYGAGDEDGGLRCWTA